MIDLNFNGKLPDNFKLKPVNHNLELLNPEFTTEGYLSVKEDLCYISEKGFNFPDDLKGIYIKFKVYDTNFKHYTYKDGCSHENYNSNESSLLSFEREISCGEEIYNGGDKKINIYFNKIDKNTFDLIFYNNYSDTNQSDNSDCKTLYKNLKINTEYELICGLIIAKSSL